MNQIDTLITHLRYDVDRRVVLINADDFRRPGDLAYLNISNDIVVIVGELRRLHRWKGIQYPNAEIFRFFVGGGDIATSRALAAQGVALAHEIPKLKNLPWLVLSDESESVLASLRACGIRKCQACKLQKPEKQLTIYQDIVGEPKKPSLDEEKSRNTTTHSARTIGGCDGKKLRNYKYEYPDKLTETGLYLNSIVEQQGGGFPISLVKLGRLIERHEDLLPEESLALFRQHRAICKKTSRAVQILAKQSGLRVDGQNILGSVCAS